MLLINDLLPYFWANADIIYTKDNIGIILLNDNEVELELVLFKKDGAMPLRISLIADLGLDDFIRLFELKELSDLEQISTETLLRLMADDEITYKVVKDLS
ncbi:hypothetical protein ABIE26_003952 [Pedobacter africanus]|uniref:Uncharacterized protein n=1 Tax=Pedobacter africanus TaxID=151894 RepID=A0ACC6L1Q9_9SPHI|nr:hypothetical protein [Pedobacter africanus]MDR6785253.1 hypothetical protein [Pedobacter africanus]